MNLTIVSQKSGQPLVMLAENEAGGFDVVGGNPQVAQDLNLAQFSTLPEVADYINGMGSDLQAIADEESMEQEPNPTIDDRIGPAIQILRELLDRVQQRKQSEEAVKQTAQIGSANESFGAEPMMDAPYTVYLTLSADTE